VINWHDRSLAPERLWGRTYRTLVSEVESGNRVWFARAGQAVAWFRWRRSIRFAADEHVGNISITAAVATPGLPAGVVRTYRDRHAVEERPFDGRADLCIRL
jgi:hypothetical protein